MDSEDLGKTIEAFFNGKERWQTFPVPWNPNPKESQEFKELLDVFLNRLARPLVRLQLFLMRRGKKSRIP